MQKTMCCCWVLLILVSLVPPATAQGTSPGEGGNPFDGEYEYVIGDQLAVNVRVGGLVWRRFWVDAGDQSGFQSGEEVRTEVGLEADNPTDDNLTLTLIFLLEDERGNQLERIELKRFKVQGGRLEEDIQKVKIDGGVLAETAKVYFFAEVD